MCKQCCVSGKMLNPPGKQVFLTHKHLETLKLSPFSKLAKNKVWSQVIGVANILNCVANKGCNLKSLGLDLQRIS